MTPRKTIPLFEVVSIMEALVNPKHPFHALAQERYESMQKEAQEERVEQGREMMREQWNNMTTEEANEFHNTWLA